MPIRRVCIVIGAVSSYLLFAIGWALFGISSLRAGVFPRAICVAIVIGGLLGFQSLLPPFGIPLGLGDDLAGCLDDQNAQPADVTEAVS